MSEQTARLVDRLRARLQHTMRRITWARVAFGSAVLVGTLAALWLAAAAVEAGLWLDTTPRTALAVVIAAATLGVVGAYLARPLGQLLGVSPSPSDEEIARTVGRAYPEVSDRLVNLLQLAEGQSTRAPAPFVDRAVQRLGEEVDPVPFEEIEDFHEARRALRLASLPVVGVLAFLLLAPSSFLGASGRLLAPQTHFQRPAPFQLSVQPGNVELVKGDSLEIRVYAAGEAPQRVTLALQAQGEQRPQTVPMQADSSGVYRHTVAGVREALRYRVTADPVETAWFDAEVLARPLVRRLDITLDPPAYTGLPTRSLDPNVGNITGLPGTEVSVTAELGGPEVDAAEIAFDDGTTVPLDVSGSTATGSFPLQREGRYRLRLRSTENVRNRDPIRYSLSLRADARPSVALLAPEPDAALDDDLATNLRLRLSDDFGFAKLSLYYRLAEKRFGEGDDAFSSMELPLENPGQLDQEIVYTWLLAQDSGLNLVRGDVVEYYVRVWDNDAVAGYKDARTATQRLRLPSLAESFERLNEEQNAAENQMQDLEREADEMSEQFRELRDELRRTQSADWQDQRQLEQIQKKRQKVQQGVEELSQQMQEITQQMQEESLVSPETSQKYEELQRVIEEINSPELKEALQKLQQSMQDLDLKQMQEAMEDFEFSEQQYRERLQRALDLFKQLKAQQKLEEMAKRAGDLSELEKRLAEETETRMKDGDPRSDDAEQAPSKEQSKEASQQQDEASTEQSGEEASEERSAADTTAEQDGESEADESADDAQQSAEENAGENAEEGAEEQADGQMQEDGSQDSQSGEASANEDLAQEQERAAERMQQLMQEMQQLSEEMQNSSSAPKQQLQQMNEQMQRQQLQQQMQRNAQQLRNGQMQDAQQGQQRMQQQLQQMQQRMQQMQQSMQGQQMQINMAGLRSALDNILRLSQDQEALRRSVRDLSSDTPQLRTYAQEQKELVSGLQTVADSLQKLARKIPQMTRKVQEESGSALRDMEQATTNLSERNASPAAGHQKGSMMHLNELALLLSDLLSQMQGGGQGSGGGMSMQQMMQNLQKMTGEQQKLNRQIQQFLNDVQGDRLSKNQEQRLQQLARQQQRIQEELQQLEQQGGDLNDQILGDLNRIAEEMQKTIDDLQQGRQNERTVERQRQILTRMLQAQQSLQTQGKQEKREGQSPEDAFEDRERPGELAPQDDAETLRRDLIRALESGYAPDYEELIKRYFDLLQQQNGSAAPDESPPSSGSEDDASGP